MKQRIGVLGGTFDPIHIGHLIFAEQVRVLCGLDKVIFIPAKNPPHKLNDGITMINHRFEMVKIAIQSNEYFEISDIEMLSDNLSYTYNTLKKMKKELGDSTELYFIVGSDAWLDLDEWYKSEALLNEFSFIIGDRPGYKDDLVNDKIRIVQEKYNTDVRKIDIHEIDISSSYIRDLVFQRKSIKYLTTELVEKYISDNKLYFKQIMGDRIDK
jgi:nicotinate-nucleotide adenylyltransferase